MLCDAAVDHGHHRFLPQPQRGSDRRPPFPPLVWVGMALPLPASPTPKVTALDFDWLPSVRTMLLVALVLGLALSISVSQITLAALAVWVLVARWAGRLAPLGAPLLAPLVAFAAWSVVTALASARPLESLVACKSLLNFAALLVLVNALSDATLVRRFATWLVLALAVAAVIGIVQVVACPGPEATAHGSALVDRFLRKCTRARGFYSIYMTLGGVLALALTMVLPRLARLSAGTWWLAPVCVIVGAGLALTYVRGAWLGFAAGAVAAMAGLGRRGVLAGLALVLLVAALLVGLPGVNARLKTIGDARDATTRDRLAMLEAGRRLGFEHPVMGVGPGQLKHLYPTVATPEAVRRSTSHLHNTPLQIAVERGVIGLAAWLWIFVAFLVRGVTLLRRLPAEAAGDRALVLGALSAVVTFLVAGLFEYNFGDTEVLLVVLAVMALPFALNPHRPTVAET
jgi:putative inorganic carbon (hco3(-)) transporter